MMAGLRNATFEAGLPSLVTEACLGVSAQLTKSSLDPVDLNTYRPILQLQFVSKLELDDRSDGRRFVHHCDENKLLHAGQSAYRPRYRTSSSFDRNGHCHRLQRHCIHACHIYRKVCTCPLSSWTSDWTSVPPTPSTTVAYAFTADSPVDGTAFICSRIFLVEPRLSCPETIEAAPQPTQVCGTHVGPIWRVKWGPSWNPIKAPYCFVRGCLEGPM